MGPNPPSDPACDLLLRTCLLQDRRVVDSWETLQTRTPVETLDSRLHPLLLLAYENLTRHGVEQPGMEKLRGLARYAWTSNQRLLHSVEPVLAALVAAGVVPVVLTNASPAVGNSVLRRIETLALGVPFDQATDAEELIFEHGWTPCDGNRRASHPEARRWSCAGIYRNAVDLRLTLAWHLIPDTPSLEADHQLRMRSREGQIRGLSVLNLSPEDRLLVTGVRIANPPEHACVAIADMADTIRRHPQLDWENLISSAERFRLMLPLLCGLERLADEYDLVVPDSVLEALRRIPVHGFERRSFEAKCSPRGGRSRSQRLAIAYGRYRRYTTFSGLGHAPWGFVAYLLQRKLTRNSAAIRSKGELSE